MNLDLTLHGRDPFANRHSLNKRRLENRKIPNSFQMVEGKFSKIEIKLGTFLKIKTEPNFTVIPIIVETVEAIAEVIVPATIIDSHTM